MSFEALLEDEENQKNGVTYILDESGFRLSHLAHVNLRDVQRVMINGEASYPPRLLMNTAPICLSLFPETSRGPVAFAPEEKKWTTVRNEKSRAHSANAQ